jgi:hypothetical protein
LLLEQNAFLSQIDAGAQTSSYREEVLARQDLENADYFVALCGQVPRVVESVRILNDDAYVLTLEHDVGVLHAAEDRLAGENKTLAREIEKLERDIETLVRENTLLVERLATEERRTSNLTEELTLEREQSSTRIQDLEWWVHHYRKMTPLPAYYALRGLYLARTSVEALLRDGPRAFLDRAARFALKRLDDVDDR